MITNDELDELIAGGLIGAALGALVSKKGSNGAVLGAIAGAAIAASLNAKTKSQKSSLPRVVKQSNYIYKIMPDGSKKIIKRLPAKAVKKFPKEFNLGYKN